jgi:hypothetical protein
MIFHIYDVVIHSDNLAPICQINPKALTEISWCVGHLATMALTKLSRNKSPIEDI